MCIKEEKQNKTKQCQALKHPWEHTLVWYLAITISTCIFHISSLVSGSGAYEVTSAEGWAAVSKYRGKFLNWMYNSGSERPCIRSKGGYPCLCTCVTVYSENPISFTEALQCYSNLLQFHAFQRPLWKPGHIPHCTFSSQTFAKVYSHQFPMSGARGVCLGLPT